VSGALAGELARLEQTLERVLGAFESERFPAPETMDSTWTDLRRAFERVRAELAPAAEHGEHERLERCQRLYAVATSVLSRRRDELAHEREACAAARRRLGGLRSAGESGASCDVRG